MMVMMIIMMMIYATMMMMMMLGSSYRCKPGGPRSREAIVKMLLDNGADANDVDFHGFTPIHFASMWGKPSLHVPCMYAWVG